MNKSQLIDALAERYDGNRKAAQEALEAVLDTITREIAAGEKVAITGFGSFEKRVRGARWVRNPQTGERLRAKKTSVPKFTAGQQFKDVTSGARKLPALPRSGGTARSTARASAARAASSSSVAGETAASKGGPGKTTTRKATATAKKAASR